MLIQSCFISSHYNLNHDSYNVHHVNAEIYTVSRQRLQVWRLVDSVYICLQGNNSTYTLIIPM